MPDLHVSHLSKSYESTGDGAPLEILRDVSLQLRSGDSLAVVGPSGSGKSTLLQIIGTLDQPTSGQVTIDGDDPFALSERELAAFRNEKVGFVFQDHHLLPQLTVIENVLLPAMASKRVGKDALQRATELLERVGLAERHGHLPSQLSGGERERVAIARALLNKPSLVLADEPTGNLDGETADRVARMLLDMQRDEKVILIVVTHSPELAAMMQRSRRLTGGRLADETTPQQP